MIEVRLSAFYIEGNKLHLTLEYPDQIKLSPDSIGIEATAHVGVLDRKEALRCKSIEELKYKVKNSIIADRLVALNAFQDAENIASRRLTVRKAVDRVLFPVKTEKAAVTKRREIATSSRPYAQSSAYYSTFESIGINEINYSQKIVPELASKYPSLAILCTLASEEEINGAINNASGNEDSPA